MESVTLEIFTKYIECHPKGDQPEEKPPELDVEDRLVKLLETQKLATNEVRVYSEVKSTFDNGPFEKLRNIFLGGTPNSGTDHRTI